MLKRLTINNYALIEHTCIDFSKGFSVITGETGAGKSIMLGALGLLLGQRADVGALRNPEAKCVTEAVFDISAYHLQQFFAENDLDYDDECVIHREIAPNGKSRAFINDMPVVLTVLKALGDHLLDIHSQHQNLLLSNAGFQLNVVDVVAGCDDLLKQYKTRYVAYRHGLVQLKKLTDAASKGASDLEFVQFQFNQLQEAHLKAGEQEELETEQNTLSNAEAIKEGLSRANWLLSEGDGGNILSNLKDAVSALSAVVDAYPQVKGEIDRLNSSLIELKDVARELDACQNSVEANPDRLEQVDARLSLLYSLEQKHKVETVGELIALRDSLEQQLTKIDSYDEEILALKKQLAQQQAELKQLAANLSEKRKNAAPGLEKELADLLHSLGMPNARIQVGFEPAPTLGEMGTDVVSFLFSANKDRSLQPIASIASGGEMARVMLSLKSVLSRSLGMPTIIFDEIDTGVSGDIAAKMGSIMQQMGQYMQVISITHLPQIAAKGTSHYLVYKEDTDDATVSHIRQLSDEERVGQLARMLSGDQLTEAAVQNAKELLKAN